MKRIFFVLALAAALTLTSGSLQANSSSVFDVDVSLVTGNIFDGTGYLWTYQVCASGATNKGLSHWTLSICDAENSWSLGTDDMLYFDLSFFTASGSDYLYYAPGADTLFGTADDVQYKVEFGTDSTTGIKGVKFEHDGVDGTQIGDTLTCDLFQFRLTDPFDVVTRDWAAKGGEIIDTGDIDRPACIPDTPPSPPAVPEPATLLLVGLGGLVGGAMVRRPHRRRS